jgi:hypothetical protein
MRWHRLAVAAVLCFSAWAPAQAGVFTWSFSNDVGGIDGTVSGTLEVADGLNVAATSVLLTETSNPIFDAVIGLDFTGLPVFSNQFNVVNGVIEAANFSNDWFQSNTNISLELESGVFGDADSQNLGLLTIAGNPLPGGSGGDDACPTSCLQTAPLFGDNSGQTQFAPVFEPVPAPATGLLMLAGLGALWRRRAGGARRTDANRT